MNKSKIRSELNFRMITKNQEECMRILEENQFLIEGSIRTYGSTVFHLACYHGLHEVVTYLVEKCIDIHETDSDGENALFYVLDCRDQTMVEKLHRLGISLNAINHNGDSVLIDAASINLNSIIVYLIENGADVNHENKNGDSLISHLIENYNKGKRIISMDFLMKHYNKFNEENQKELKKLRLRQLVEKGMIK